MPAVSAPTDESHAPPVPVDLSTYDNRGYDPGRGALVRILWYFASLLLVDCAWMPVSRVKAATLRLFGATIGRGVRIKPRVRVKYPWRLRIGDHAWIGEEAWIDNLADVTIGSHVCISQGVYLCTGSHDHRKPSFDLLLGAITVEDGAWLGARSMVLQNVTVGSGAIVAGGSVVRKDVAAGVIVAGNPARAAGSRNPLTQR